MGDILSKYDLLGAFELTVYLAFWSALGALVIGTLVAVLRVSPVRVLQLLGACYVNVIRNTPLALLMVFSVLGASYALGLNLDPSDVRNDATRWAIAVLSAYHAAFVCEAWRSGLSTVPVGQAEAARALGLTSGQSLRHVLLPQAFRGAIAPLGSTLVALVRNTTVAAVVGVAEAAGLMQTMVENETSGYVVLAGFLVLATGFVILTLPVGLAVASLSRRMGVRR